ncbi:MAG TPA: hypothetical protein VLS85_00375 [Hanamia sp.]|nr:hypothetical protein [Hanamia sp.]
MTGCLLKKEKQESPEIVALLPRQNKASIEETRKIEIQFISLFTNTSSKTF